jgi:hypothetical protein
MASINQQCKAKKLCQLINDSDFCTNPVFTRYAKDHPFFGMDKDNKCSVQEVINTLRGDRYADRIVIFADEPSAFPRILIHCTVANIE